MKFLQRTLLLGALLAGAAEVPCGAAVPPVGGHTCTWKFARFFEVQVKTSTETFLCDFDPLREAVHGDWKTNYCHAGNRVVQLQRRNVPGVQSPGCRIVGER